MEFDVFAHTAKSEAAQPVLSLDGFNMLEQVDIRIGDRVAKLGHGKHGVVKSYPHIVSGKKKARVMFDDGTVRHYEKSELRKVTT